MHISIQITEHITFIKQYLEIFTYKHLRNKYYTVPLIFHEQAVAMTTAANSVVQDSMKIGTGLKTISMRIRSSKTEIESAGLDTEGMATSTAKLRKEIKALSGVDIMKNANEFKSTYDILDELAEKWSSLTDIKQANACLYVQKCA